MKRHTSIAVLCCAWVPGPAVVAQVEQPPNIRDFVQRKPIHGGESYSELTTLYDASVTLELMAMLQSATEEPHWARIAGLLGAVGDQRASKALITFIGKPGGQPLTPAHDAARNEAIRSLGFLVYRTGDEQALKYLLDSLTPAVWRQRNVEGVSPWMTSYSEYDLSLSKYAIFGLALSGNSRAGEALKSLQRSPTPQQAAFRSGLDDVLEQWLEVHQLVVERGLEGMYDYYAEKRRLDAERATEEAARLRELQRR